jgi:hypothetical protein
VAGGAASACTPQSDEGLVHVRWFERDGASGRPMGGRPAEYDSVVFPGECRLQPVGGWWVGTPADLLA